MSGSVQTVNFRKCVIDGDEAKFRIQDAEADCRRAEISCQQFFRLAERLGMRAASEKRIAIVYALVKYETESLQAYGKSRELYNAALEERREGLESYPSPIAGDDSNRNWPSSAPQNHGPARS